MVYNCSKKGQPPHGIRRCSRGCAENPSSSSTSWSENVQKGLGQKAGEHEREVQFGQVHGSNDLRQLVTSYRRSRG
jgi:hypothetical protein